MGNDMTLVLVTDNAARLQSVQQGVHLVQQNPGYLVGRDQTCRETFEVKLAFVIEQERNANLLSEPDAVKRSVN